MGVPKPIYLLDAPVRALALTDLFPARDPIAGNGPAHKYTLQDLADLLGAAAAAANNGLQFDGAHIQLGQPAGNVTDPAILLGDTEIPDGGFILFVGKDDGVSPIVGFDALDGIVQISNQDSGNPAFVIFDGHDYAFETDTVGGTASIGVKSPSTIRIIFDRVNTLIKCPEIFQPVKGLKRPTRTLTAGAQSITNVDFFLHCDSSGGDVNISINPSQITGGNFIIKKTSSDANNVNLVPSSGTIQELGAPAASFAINGQGEATNLYSDGTNLFCY